MADTDNTSRVDSQYLQVPSTTQGDDRSSSPSGTSHSGSGDTSPTSPASRNGSSTRLRSSGSGSGGSSPRRNTNIGYNFIMEQEERHIERGTTTQETSLCEDAVALAVLCCFGCCGLTCCQCSMSVQQETRNATTITSGDGGNGQEQPRPRSPRMEYGNSPDHRRSHRMNQDGH